MRSPGAIRRWLVFLTAIRGRPEPRVLTHDIKAWRRRQRAIARQAFLSTLPPARRALHGPQFGDTQ